MTVDIKCFYIIRIKHSINTVSDKSLLPKVSMHHMTCYGTNLQQWRLLCSRYRLCSHNKGRGGFFLHNNMLGYICLIFKSQKHWWATESFPLCSNIPFSVFASNLLIIWIKLSQFGSWLDKWCFFKLVSSALWLINIQKLC